jgi:hypothetical protein
MTHQRKYAGKQAHGMGNQPDRTKEEVVAYHRQWAIEKQKRTKIATPIWANKEAIKEIYKTAVRLTESTGNVYEVDHIVPLVAKDKISGKHIACGLHVENNLEIMLYKENCHEKNCYVDIILDLNPHLPVLEENVCLYTHHFDYLRIK